MPYHNVVALKRNCTLSRLHAVSTTYLVPCGRRWDPLLGDMVERSAVSCCSIKAIQLLAESTKPRLSILMPAHDSHTMTQLCDLFLCKDEVGMGTFGLLSKHPKWEAPVSAKYKHFFTSHPSASEYLVITADERLTQRLCLSSNGYMSYSLNS